MNAHAHNHGLPAQDVPLHVLDGLIAAVRDEDHTRKARVLHLRQEGLHAPGVGNVAGKLPVVHGHVRSEGIHDKGCRLFQGKVFLVASPVDVREGAAVSGTGCGVNRAEFILLDPLSTIPEQVHPVLLRDPLRQPRDHRRIQLRFGRRLHHPLPASHPAVVVPGHDRIICKRQYVIHHLGVPVENGQQVLPQTGLVGNPLQQPDIPVQAVLVLALMGHAPLLVVRCQFVNLAQVPAFRKDELATLLHGSIQVLLPGDELQLRGKRPPVEQAVLPLAVFGQVYGCVLAYI